MDIYLGSKKIGTLQGAKVNGLGIEGFWPGLFDPTDAQNEAYTLNGGNMIFVGCRLRSSRGLATGLYVKFVATRQLSEAPGQSIKNKKTSILPNKG